MLIRGLFALLCGLLASPAWAAITFDAVGTGEGTTSATYNTTIAADANVAIVCVATRDVEGVSQARA